MAPRAICGARCEWSMRWRKMARESVRPLRLCDLSVEIEKLFETMSTDVVRFAAGARQMDDSEGAVPKALVPRGWLWSQGHKQGPVDS